VTTYIALLRAVNVGGTGKLPMADLRRLAEDAGFTDVETYIQSGNLLLTSDEAEAEVGATLESTLEQHLGKPVGVMVRTPSELRGVLDGNPFPDAPGNRVLVTFLPAAPPSDALETVSRADDGEQVRTGRRALYVYYPNGMGRSKLRIPAAAAGTARNLNTVAKLVQMAEKRQNG
jgi:uncharacterized protein (DUF1697 family)